MDRSSFWVRRRSRRAFLHGSLVLAGLGCASACGLAPAQSNPPAPIRRVGLFHVGLDHIPPSLETLRDELGALRYQDGTNILLDWRNLPDEAAARSTAQAFVRDRVDVIVAFENQTIRAARAATSDIPIVFLHGDEPVANGFVQSFAHPGGNTTGFAGGSLGVLSEKRLEFFKALVPGLRRLLALIDPQDPTTPRLLAELRKAARVLQIELLERDTGDQADLEEVFNSLRPGEVDGIFPVSPTLQVKFSSLLIHFGARTHLPVMAHRKEWVEQGALYSYGPNIGPTGRAGARYVDRILRGARPADLPVVSSDDAELVVNQKVAVALGLNLPMLVLEQAEQLIQ